MTGTPAVELRTPVPNVPPPCRADPDRWFDRAHRTHALAACLQCPARRWCAREALRTEPSWGMWAGIWIDGKLADAVPYLHAIATDAPAFRSTPATTLATPPAPRTHHWERRPLPRTGFTRAGQPRSIAATVLARSSGHCEVASERCHLTADTHLSRVADGSPRAASSAAEVVAACTSCAESMAALDRREARRLGYVIDSSPQAPNVPLYWRCARWVLLGRLGQLHDAGSAVDAARAS
jgi:hypothetical protein